jgi:hypothetical protein
MAKKTFSAEQIIGKLREVEVLTSQGKTVTEACRALSIRPTTAGAKSTVAWAPNRPNG